MVWVIGFHLQTKIYYIICFCHVINACGQSYKLTRTSKTNNFPKLLVIIQCWNSIFCRPTNGWEKSPTPCLARQDTHWCREHMWEMVSAKQKSKMEKVSLGRKCILKLFGDLRKLEWLKWSFRISQCLTLVVRFQICRLIQMDSTLIFAQKYCVSQITS